MPDPVSAGKLDETPTLRVAASDWLMSRSVGKPSPHTTGAYQRDIAAISAHLAAHLGRTGEPLDVVRVGDLTVRSLRGAFALYAGTHAKASIARAQSTWRGLCTFAVAEDWLPGDPMSGLERVRAPRREPKPLRGEAVTAGALVAFLSSTGRAGRHPWPERDLAAIAVLLLTGLRSAELRSLHCGDVFGPAEERRLRVIGKGDKQRTVPIEAALERTVEVYLVSRASRFPGWQRGYDEPLLVSNTNTALTASQLRYLVETCLRRAGLGAAAQAGAMVHGLRHTFATMLADNGASAAEIMELMGHGSLNTSQGYIKASAREVRRTAAANPLYMDLPADN